MRKRKGGGGLEKAVLALALGLGAFVLYQFSRRAPEPPPEVVRPPEPKEPVRVHRVVHGYPIAGSKRPANVLEPSPSFEAVRTVPPIAISRTGRPTIRTKAPPPPKPVE